MSKYSYKYIPGLPESESHEITHDELLNKIQELESKETLSEFDLNTIQVYRKLCQHLKPKDQQ